MNTPATSTMHIYSFITKQQQWGQLLRKRLPWSTCWTSSVNKCCYISYRHTGFILAGSLYSATMEWYNLVVQDYGHFHWFPQLQMGNVTARGVSRVNIIANGGLKNLQKCNQSFKWTNNSPSSFGFPSRIH